MSPPLPFPLADYFERKLAGHGIAHKIDGDQWEDAGVCREVLRGVRALLRHDVKCLLVSGPGVQLDAELRKKRLHPRTHLPIVERKHIPKIEEAIHHVGETLAAQCRQLGIPHRVLPHAITRATRLLDGHKETGGVVSVAREAIYAAFDEDELAILPFGGVDAAVRTLYVGAEDVAARAAAAVNARKLIMYSDEAGLMVPTRHGRRKKISFLDLHQLLQLIRACDPQDNFVVGEESLPTIKAVYEALAYGVPQVHVVQARSGALLEELFTRTGSGTLIEREPFLELDFPARTQQLGEIVQLRQECSRAATPSGVPYLKPLPLEELERLLPNTLVLRQRDLIVGAAYFHAVPEHADTAILGGFAVGENHQDSGYGRLLLESALEQIHEFGFTRAVSITAAEPVKHLYEQYAHDASAAWPDLLAQARRRYGPDQDLVRVYEFPSSAI
ncbi:MAG: GNAT family N-acetyltransferase [Planctomycetes bacterium]|nr:GNAT family N-acetyltransferase [Planctomycetota bacterium]